MMMGVIASQTLLQVAYPLGIIARVGVAIGSGAAAATGVDLQDTYPLDGLGATSAFSLSRDLLTSFIGGTRYTTLSGTINKVTDQTGGAGPRDFMTDEVSAHEAVVDVAGTNARTAMSFDGVNDYMSMTGSAPLSSIITVSTGYVICSCVVDAASTTDATSAQGNDAIFADSSNVMGVYAFNTAGAHSVRGYNNDGNADAPTAHPITVGAAIVVEWKHASGNVMTRLNGGSWNSTASGNTANLIGSLAIGAKVAGTPQYLDCRIAELATFNSLLTTPQEDALAADFLSWIGGTAAAGIVAGVGAASGVGSMSGISAAGAAIGTAYGLGSMAGVGASIAAAGGTAVGIGSMTGVGAAISAPLDGLAAVTGAWSLSRDLLSSFIGGTRFTQSGSNLTGVNDQSGNARNLGTPLVDPVVATAGPLSRTASQMTTSNQRLQTAAGDPLSDFISNSTGYIIVSGIFTTLTANQANVWLNHCLMVDTGLFMGIHGKTGGLALAANWDGSSDSTSVSISTATAYVFEWRHEGGTLGLRVNGGTEATTASGNTTKSDWCLDIRRQWYRQ